MSGKCGALARFSRVLPSVWEVLPSFFPGFTQGLPGFAQVSQILPRFSYVLANFFLGCVLNGVSGVLGCICKSL